MVKIGRSILGFLLVCSIFFSNSIIVTCGESKKAQEPKPSQLYAKSAVLMDGAEKRVLFEKNGEEKLPMASTTKIMTLIVTLELGDLDQVVTVSKLAARQPDVQLNINSGEQYYLKDLLYSLMLESHNDAAYAIGEHIGGRELGLTVTEETTTEDSEKMIRAFAGLMNQKAKEIGCSNTYFITPNGLDAEDSQGIHSTTARDLAAIMSYCILESPKKELFLEITGTSSYSFSSISGKRSFSVANHNAFLSMMDGALSGKTGFTAKAGYCYVGALRRGDRTFVVALLACGWPNNKTYKWSDTKTLMNYGLSNYENRDVWKEITLDPVFVEGGIPKSNDVNDPALAEIGFSKDPPKEKKILLRDDEKVEVNLELKKSLTAPVKQGETVGRVIYKLNDTILWEYPISLKESVEKISYPWCFFRVLGKLLTLS